MNLAQTSSCDRMPVFWMEAPRDSSRTWWPIYVPLVLALSNMNASSNNSWKSHGWLTDTLQQPCFLLLRHDFDTSFVLLLLLFILGWIPAVESAIENNMKPKDIRAHLKTMFSFMLQVCSHNCNLTVTRAQKTTLSWAKTLPFGGQHWYMVTWRTFVISLCCPHRSIFGGQTAQLQCSCHTHTYTLARTFSQQPRGPSAHS